MASFIFGIVILSALLNQSVARSIDRRMAEKRVLLGGYRKIDTKDEGVVTVANFAFDSALENSPFALTLTDSNNQVLDQADFEYKVLEASLQVVAGLNYNLSIGVFRKGLEINSCVGGFNVIVYNHFGELSVIQWLEVLTYDEVTNMISENDKEGR